MHLSSRARRGLCIVVALFAGLAAACGSKSGAQGLPHVPSGFVIEAIARVDGARELAIDGKGNLFVGTSGSDVYLIEHADGSQGAAVPRVFVHFDDAPAAGVTLSQHTLFVGTQFGVYRVDLTSGTSLAHAPVRKLVAVRTSGIARDHTTTSVAYTNNAVYASVGASCNACVPDLDATRATIERIDPQTGHTTLVARRIRNAIALGINPASGVLWAGDAGVDDLDPGHPYEIFDAVTLHATPVDYGYPACFENHRMNPHWPANCSGVAVARVVFPAYSTPIGVAFYPQDPHERYAFPKRYRGGAFVTLHGSWHGPAEGLSGYVPPRVVYVPMHGDDPATAPNWQNPNAQWFEFLGGYQDGGTNQRIGRPTGIAVGPSGSLFVADDLTGAIYRIRPR